MAMPEPNSPEGLSPPLPGNQREVARAMLDLCPYPAVLVAVNTGEVVLANEAAQALRLPPSADDANLSGYQARDEQDAVLDPRQVIPHLLSRTNAGEGSEILWRTPERSFCFRVLSRSGPIATDSGTLVLLSFVDITAWKEGEAELRKALELRDEFVSIAAHELRDPVFAFQLSLEFLRHSAGRQGEIPPHVLKHLEVSDRQVERLSRLIENLLDVSRIANHRLQLDIETFDLCELVQEMSRRFQVLAKSLDTPLAVEACEPVLGYFDRLRMEQVLVNLVSNALKYGGRRPVVLRVRAEGDEAVLEVEDHGNGIPLEDQERIFDRFQRASDGHKKESLGLGLYITRALVEAHAGTITVRSQLGQGTTFIVRLPRRHLPRASERSSNDADLTRE